jgi:hypothetical protein
MKNLKNFTISLFLTVLIIWVTNLVIDIVLLNQKARIFLTILFAIPLWIVINDLLNDLKR